MPMVRLVFVLIVGAIHKSSASDDNNKTNNQPVILSEVEVLRVERKRTSKTEEQRDEGISERVWVAFCSKCNIPLASHQKFKPYPTSPNGSCFCLFAYAQPAKVRLRASRSAQNDIQGFCLLISFVLFLYNLVIPCHTIGSNLQGGKRYG